MTHGIASGFTDQGELVHDHLIAGEFPRFAEMAFVGGGLLNRGAVLGRVSVDGRYLLSTTSATDGSQVAQVILAQDIDATTSDVEAVVYLTGEFNELVLTFGEGHTPQSVHDSLRDNSIFLRQNQAV